MWRMRISARDLQCESTNQGHVNTRTEPLRICKFRKIDRTSMVKDSAPNTRLDVRRMLADRQRSIGLANEWEEAIIYQYRYLVCLDSIRTIASVAELL